MLLFEPPLLVFCVVDGVKDVRELAFVGLPADDKEDDDD